MPNLNLHHLRYFWAVAHEGNLTRAARNLHVSQSAVSVQIRQLETELGHALFERSGNRLVLTEAGRIALDHADEIFAIEDELVGSLQVGEGGRRVVRVGALATLSRNFQLAFVRPLLGRDDVELVVTSGTLGFLLENLEEHRLDVVLVASAPPRDATSRWVLHALSEQPVSLVGAPRRRARSKDLKTILSTEPLVLPTFESSIRTGFDGLVDRLGVRPRIAAEVDDMAMLRLLARERIGLAVIPSIVVKDELDSGELVEIDQLPGLRETFFALTWARRFPNPLVRELVTERELEVD